VEYKHVLLHVDASTSGQLCLLVDTGADVSILKCDKIKGILEFEPPKRVKIKDVEGGIMHTHGTIGVKIKEGDVDVLFNFQLVSVQFQLGCDGIWGCDFL
jgi:hypothetical protein